MYLTRNYKTGGHRPPLHISFLRFTVEIRPYSLYKDGAVALIRNGWRPENVEKIGFSGYRSAMHPGSSRDRTCATTNPRSRNEGTRCTHYHRFQNRSTRSPACSGRYAARIAAGVGEAILLRLS